MKNNNNGIDMRKEKFTSLTITNNYINLMKLLINAYMTQYLDCL
jgi:hypothetical protein